MIWQLEDFDHYQFFWQKIYLTSLRYDERSHEYLIRRSSLGGHPTKLDMDVIVACEFERPRINCPVLC